MRVVARQVPISELVNGYKDSGDTGVIGYGGKLNIRPLYQREFIYKPDQERAVIDSVMNGFPLSSIFWACDYQRPDIFEVLDGQQRILSICRYYDSKFSINDKNYFNLTKEEMNAFKSYKLSVYVCTGEPTEKIKWFERINISGEKLNKQEMLNALYTGPWLADAKIQFSKTQCVAYRFGSKYILGTPIRQDYLETALKWISKNNIADYMANHQHDQDAEDLWSYFHSVIDWVNTTFPVYRKKEMIGLNWGKLYNDYNSSNLDQEALEQRISELMMDDDVTNKKGIYEYVLSEWIGKPNEKYLHIRQFTPAQKRAVYERQGKECAECSLPFDIDDMDADHIKPWIEGGKTSLDNCQMLCKEHNRRKGAK